MKPVRATLEANDQNTDGSALTLYFESEPTREEVIEACENTSGLPLGCDTNDEWFNFVVAPTVVSEKAGLVRVQCHPTC